MSLDFDTQQTKWFEGRDLCHLCGARLRTLLPHKCRIPPVPFPPVKKCPKMWLSRKRRRQYASSRTLLGDNQAWQWFAQTRKRVSSNIHLVEFRPPPKKKYLAPPAKIPQFAADTLPAPRPLPSWIFNKKPYSPLHPRRLELPLPPPRANKK